MWFQYLIPPFQGHAQSGPNLPFQLPWFPFPKESSLPTTWNHVCLQQVSHSCLLLVASLLALLTQPTWMQLLSQLQMKSYPFCHSVYSRLFKKYVCVSLTHNITSVSGVQRRDSTALLGCAHHTCGSHLSPCSAITKSLTTCSMLYLLPLGLIYSITGGLEDSFLKYLWLVSVCVCHLELACVSLIRPWASKGRALSQVQYCQSSLPLLGVGPCVERGLE